MKAFPFLLMFIKLSALVVISFSGIVRAADKSSSLCNDLSGTFTTMVKRGEKSITVNCNWVKNNRLWRCNNLPNVATNCPATCETCFTTAPAPSSTPTSFSSSIYPWCEDSTSRFEIKSLKWMQGSKKSCIWANQDGKKWFRCGIEEVKENCPVLCDFCKCKNNEGRFVLAPGLRRTCKWPKQRNAWWRCNEYPVLKDMCPLSCGECTDYQFPSDAPSAHPTIKLYSKHTTYVTVSIGFAVLVIPTDASELALLEETLIKAYENNYVPTGGKVTGVTLSSNNSRNVSNTAGSATISMEYEQICPSMCNATEDANSQAFVASSELLAAEAVDVTASTNLETEAESLGVDGKGLDLSGESSTNYTISIVDPSAQPSSSPEAHPSAAPSSQHSQRPSIFHSFNPSMVPSSMPTLTP